MGKINRHLDEASKIGVSGTSVKKVCEIKSIFLFSPNNIPTHYNQLKLYDPDSFTDHNHLSGNSTKVGGSVLASDMKKALSWSDLGL